MDAPIASSRQPGARSYFAPDAHSRLPLSVHRLPFVTSYDKQSPHARFTVYGSRSTVHGYTVNGHPVSGEMIRPNSQQLGAGSRQPAAIVRLTPQDVYRFHFLFLSEYFLKKCYNIDKEIHPIDSRKKGRGYHG